MWSGYEASVSCACSYILSWSWTHFSNLTLRAIHFSYIVSDSLSLYIINTLCLVFYNAARGQDLMVQLQHLVQPEPLCAPLQWCNHYTSKTWLQLWSFNCLQFLMFRALKRQQRMLSVVVAIVWTYQLATCFFPAWLMTPSTCRCWWSMERSFWPNFGSHFAPTQLIKLRLQ